MSSGQLAEWVLSGAGRNNRQIYWSNIYYRRVGSCSRRSGRCWRRGWLSFVRMMFGVGWDGVGKI